MTAAKFSDYSELLFHIGLHKTGTSYLQSLLRANAPVLRDVGLHYPEYLLPKRAEQADGNHSFAVLKSFPGHSLASQLDDKLNLSSSCPALLLSAEQFCQPAGIAALAQDAELLASARKPRFIVYFRRYDELTESVYSQVVKDGECGPFNPPYYGIDQGLFHRFQPLITAFGKEALIIRPYNSRLWPDGSLAADFFTAIGRPDLSREMSDRRDAKKNVAFSRSHSWLLSQIKGRTLKKLLVAYFADHPLPVAPETSRFFQSPKERRALNQAGLSADREMFAEMGIRDPVEFLDLEAFADAESWTPFVPDLAQLEPYLAKFLAHPKAKNGSGFPAEKPKAREVEPTIVRNATGLIERFAGTVRSGPLDGEDRGRPARKGTARMAAAKFSDYSELVFHIGLHKTGTSYLQSLLRANAPVLRRAGLHYPEYRRQPRAAKSDGNHSLAVLKVGQGLGLANTLDQNLDIASSCRGLILSAEGFNRREGIAALAEDAELRACKPAPRFIVYFRRYDTLSESVYAQEVKFVLSEPYSPPYYRVNQGLFHRLMPLIQAYGTDSVILRPYNPRLWPEGRLGADFCAALGRPDLWPQLADRPAGVMNVSLSRTHSWLLAQMTTRGAKIALRDHFADHPLPVPPDPSRFFQSPDQRRALNQACLEADRAMFTTMGISDPVAFLDLDSFPDADVWTPFVPDLARLEPYLANFLSRYRPEPEGSVLAKTRRIVRYVASLPKIAAHSAQMKLKNFNLGGKP